MTRYGFSDPVALTQGLSLARRATAGYFASAFLFGMGRQAGYDLILAEFLSMTFVYVFGAVALVLAGRRRMLAITPKSPPPAHAFMIALLISGSVLFLMSALMLIYMVGVIFSSVSSGH